MKKYKIEIQELFEENVTTKKWLKQTDNPQVEKQYDYVNTEETITSSHKIYEQEISNMNISELVIFINKSDR